MKISVVIPFYNRFVYVNRVLWGLNRQTRQPDEVILVDDGSTEDIKPMLDLSKITYIRQDYADKQFRAGQARNKGWKKAKGNVILFLDSDIVLLKNYLEELEVILTNSDLAAIGSEWENNAREAVRSKKYMITGTKVENASPVLFENTGEFENFVVEKEKENSSLLTQEIDWESVMTNQLAVERSLVKKQNGFDERFVGWGEEDTEFAYRCFLDKCRFVRCGALKYIHLGHPINSAKTRTELEANALRFIEKWPEMKTYPRRAWKYYGIFERADTLLFPKENGR